MTEVALKTRGQQPDSRLSSSEHWLFLQRTQLGSQHPNTPQAAVARSRESSALSGLLRHYTHLADYIHAGNALIDIK